MLSYTRLSDAFREDFRKKFQQIILETNTVAEMAGVLCSEESNTWAHHENSDEYYLKYSTLGIN